MATRFYFPLDEVAAISPAIHGLWTDSAQSVLRRLSQTKGSSAITAGTLISFGAAAGDEGLDRMYVSDPLEAQSITGTFACQLLVQEIAAADNVNRFVFHIWVCNSAGVFQARLFSTTDDEPSTGFVSTEYSDAGYRNKTGADGDAISSYTCVAGDRLVVEIA